MNQYEIPIISAIDDNWDHINQLMKCRYSHQIEIPDEIVIDASNLPEKIEVKLDTVCELHSANITNDALPKT